MKIKTKKRSYEQVMALPRMHHKKPLRPSRLLSTVIRVASLLDTIPTRSTYEKHAWRSWIPRSRC